jgi:tetratricopeptide (TPR) repeat protein
LFNLGAALQSVGDLDGAVGCFATIVDAIDPGDADARVQLAVTYHSGGHLGAAATHYAQALLLLDPTDQVGLGPPG